MKTFFIDLGLCTDCNNCLMACKDEHCGNRFPGYTEEQPRHGHRWIDVLCRERGGFPRLDVVYLPKPCMHCENAPCVEAGLAFRREDGLVLIDPEKARGHEELVSLCPYGAVWWNEQAQLPQKCTGCAHLLDEGWAMPRCADACPTGALTWREESEASEGGWETLSPASGTVPRVYYRGLRRWEKDFLTGSADLGGECLEGAEAALYGEDGTLLEKQTTNAFGEFKFDGLERGKTYRLTLCFEGKRLERELMLGDTTDLGVLALDGSDVMC